MFNSVKSDKHKCECGNYLSEDNFRMMDATGYHCDKCSKRYKYFPRAGVLKPDRRFK